MWYHHHHSVRPWRRLVPKRDVLIPDVVVDVGSSLGLQARALANGIPRSYPEGCMEALTKVYVLFVCSLFGCGELSARE